MDSRHLSEMVENVIPCCPLLHHWMLHGVSICRNILHLCHESSYACNKWVC